jgi:hypothetical protein
MQTIQLPAGITKTERLVTVEVRYLKHSEISRSKSEAAFFFTMQAVWLYEANAPSDV